MGLMAISTHTPSAGIGVDESQSMQDSDVTISMDELNDAIKKTPSTNKLLQADFSPKNTLIDSIQQNLSLEMVAERNESSVKGRRINSTLALKKADLPVVSKFD